MNKEKIYNNENLCVKNKKMKEILHPILIKLLGSMVSTDLEVEGKLPENGNYLIVANHLSIDDVPTLGDAIKEHAYILVSDEDRMTVNGFGLDLNGVEWVRRLNKKSRGLAAKHLVENLEDGANVAMYPEATWNLSPNMLILPMNYGCIRIAKEAGVPIVPVITFFGKDKRYTTIGDAFYPTDDYSASISELRDIMSTMYFNNILKDYESRSSEDGITRDESNNSYYESRDNIPEDYWDEYISKLYSAYPRAKKNQSEVRKYESQFIFTNKDDANQYFQEFNSICREEDNNLKVKRINSSEGLSIDNEFKDTFGYSYNHKVLTKSLHK